MVLETYRGYGREGAVFIMGRAFLQPVLGTERKHGSVLRDLTDLLRRFLRWGLSRRRVRVELGDAVAETHTDRRGWFSVRLEPKFPPEEDGHPLWRKAKVTLGTEGLTAEATVLAPRAPSSFAVVSDLDDTVLFTGVANVLMMMRSLFFSDADARTPFPGVSAFYRALFRGASGQEANPMLYVSRGPWGLLRVIERFFHAHDIPCGPVVFLRDWGFTLQHPLPRRLKTHKRELIETMLQVYADREFVLIGDSGQKDPEVYANIVADHPGRVKVVYIRDVSRTDARSEAIELLAERLRAVGSRLVLARDSLVMAKDAAEHGLIPAETLKEIEEAVADESKGSGLD